VFAYSEVGVRCLQVLLDAGVEVPLVVTHKDSPWEKIWFSSVLELAGKHGLKAVADPPEVVIPETDFIFSFYYRRMLPPDILRKGRKGAFNMHGSLLPRYRGRAPVNWAVLKGETETGATLHEMTEKPDAGRIVDQQAVPIGPDDTAAEVFARVTDAAERILKRSLPSLIAGTALLKPQDLSQGSYFGARKPDDGRIDWSRSAQEIHNLVRAVAPPFPGAFADGLKILKTKILPGKAKQPGPYRENGEWFAGCGDGKVLRLLEVQETK
jgi:methionyl-tRNA formyltransferase